MYYQSTDVTLLVFDVTQIGSFQGLEQWANDLKEKGPLSLQVIVVANQINLVHERIIQAVSGEEFRKEQRPKHYREVSAKLMWGSMRCLERPLKSSPIQELSREGHERKYRRQPTRRKMLSMNFENQSGLLVQNRGLWRF
jgi:GTPase SAR1 family protein